MQFFRLIHAAAALRLAAPQSGNLTYPEAANGTMGFLRTFADIEAAFCGESRDGQSPELCATLKKFRVCGDCSGGSIERLGEANDGGYLVCPSNGLAGGISLGINGFDGFGAELSQKYSVPVQQYDCYNTKAPAVPPGANCRFSPLCLRDKPSQDPSRFLALSEFVGRAPAGDLLLKMDVEGAEWGALDAATPATLSRFEQITLEVHQLHDTSRYALFGRVMDKLLADFVLVYNHGNNCPGNVAWAQLGQWQIPRVFELTFVRKSGPVKSTACVSTRPTAHDSANCHWNDHPVPVNLPAA
jgi:hypothetical protein